MVSTSACFESGNDDGMDDVSDDTMSGDGDGDTADTGDGDTSDTTNDGCWEQPEICEQFVRCIGAILPEQYDSVEGQYGVEGSCWCNSTDDAANECLKTCAEQVETALNNYPTEPLCQKNYCPLEELNTDEPYGPVENGACPQWEGYDQLPLMNPLGLPGSVCSPPCLGIANSCPEHTQTSAAGTCLLQVMGEGYCVNYCYVDSELIGGTQCQCGARCQPYGGPDGEGNLRGICTFE